MPPLQKHYCVSELVYLGEAQKIRPKSQANFCQPPQGDVLKHKRQNQSQNTNAKNISVGAALPYGEINKFCRPRCSPKSKKIEITIDILPPNNYFIYGDTQIPSGSASIGAGFTSSFPVFSL
jgi:hypothetical protein